MVSVQLEQLEKAQRFALRIVVDDSYQLEYHDLLAATNSVPIETILSNICRDFIKKIRMDPTHILYNRLPKKQSAVRRHSSRLKDTPLLTVKSTLRQHSIFNNKHFI